MKKLIAPASLAILTCVLLLAAVLLVGCSKGEDAASTAGTPGTAPAAAPSPSTGAPTPGSAPGSSAPSSGVDPMAASPDPMSAPSANPGTAPGAAQSPSAGASSAATAPKGTIPFSKVALKSPVTRTAVDMGGFKVESLRFKYAGPDGKICVCEMPADEAKQFRSPKEWSSTFELYRTASTDKPTKRKKQKIERLNDFPFVSPPPAQPSGNKQPVGPMSAPTPR